MTRKLSLGLGFLILLVAVAAVWTRPRSGLVIEGALSKEDQTQILRLVKRDLWRQSLPDLSWQTVKRTPRSLYHAATARIVEVIVAPPAYRPSAPEVQVKGRLGLTHAYEYYWGVEKRAGGWAVGWRAQRPTVLLARASLQVERWSAGPSFATAARLSGAISGTRLEEVGSVMVVPPPARPKKPLSDFDGGTGFSGWISNHAKVSLSDGQH